MPRHVRHFLEALLLLGLLLFAAMSLSQEPALANWPAPPYWSPTASVRQSTPGDKSDAVSERETLAVPTNPLAFTGIAPCRVADTRNASFPAGYGPPFMSAGVPRNFTIWGRCGIPATAEAVSFNFTVVNPVGPGFLKVYPQDGPQPVVSTLNYSAAQTIANAAVVPLGTGGGLTAIPGVSGFDLIIDVNGYYAPGQGLILPYAGTVGSSGGPAFAVTNTGGNVAVSGTFTDSTTSSYGVLGSVAAGVWGQCNINGGSGVRGESSSGSGVSGTSDSGTGVEGDSYWGDGVYGASWSGYGVHGTSMTGDGVVGEASAPSKSGVYAVNPNPSGYAGFFLGNVHVTGNLSTGGAKPFRIDHPLDPENRELWHAAVESNEVLNVYSGNAVTNLEGVAVVQLPAWFEALNTDFRYQLTVIGCFAQAIVEQEVMQNRFTIRTDHSAVKVSWQVTARRNDAWIRAHPFVAEQEKPENERGAYLAPLEHGQPPERGVEWARHSENSMRLQKDLARTVEMGR
jgi:hypothetical protein